MILTKTSFLIALFYGVTFSAAVDLNLVAKQSMKSVNNKMSADGSADAEFSTRTSMKSTKHNGQELEFSNSITLYKKLFLEHFNFFRRALARTTSPAFPLRNEQSYGNRNG